MSYRSTLSSLKNPALREAESLLHKARVRRQEGKFLIEGEKEISLALEAGIQISHYFMLSGEAPDRHLHELQMRQIPGFECPQALMERISYRKGGSNLVVVAKSFQRKLIDMDWNTGSPLLLVVEAVEKPGNLGAMLRTADAVGVDGLVFCDVTTEMFNPNVIRASLGTLFTVPWVQCRAEELQMYIKASSMRLLATDLEGAVSYLDETYTGPTAILVGTEATGISEAWRSFAHARIKIPMAGKIDSMNVSVAAAIMLFEARRQRHQGSFEH
jgi:TrmH family RNA methyltransferase